LLEVEEGDEDPVEVEVQVVIVQVYPGKIQVVVPQQKLY
jgi:hypothetical protein